MKITHEIIKHTAGLARLSFQPKEVEKFTNELSGILNYIDQLQLVDTKGVESTHQTSGLVNVTREDICKKIYVRDDMLNSSPQTDNGHVEVKKVVHK